MRMRLITTCALLVGMMTPGLAPAEKWYHEGWFIGSAAFAGGGLLGYIVGRETAPDRTVYGPAYYTARYDDGPIHSTGGYYVRDKRAFPFYRKIEIYPVASTMPRVYKPQAVSVVNAADWPALARSAEKNGDESLPSTVNVTVGDNNENVTIYVMGSEVREEDEFDKEIVQVPNHPKSLPGRVVDVKVDVPKEDTKAAEAEAAESEASASADESDKADKEE